ncbi:MAG: ABC transporter permease [Gammaproteobacteria bacterium]|jgi:polar amino acid transport system permease protein|nr:ABC transporter permease [Gammaproteobacteria bacterium]MBT3724440.1 ABC transporter permease [Gammaproteobacteria bacterium]MBT4195610.1 ABC transporter permease [Gammaproteobacteria bacterium]MBT4450557.1 ABC transporter permease [Gammaproteobacteria bacterium]MBT4860665.1 ABC transporter permease [Gammaproteobacteria bacterium]
MPDFSLITQYGDRFWDGTLITLKLVFLSSVLGLMIALPLALARSSNKRRFWIPAYSYIYFFRGTPLLIQLFILYYGLGQFPVITDSFLWPVLGDAEWCGLIGLTLNTAAYTAEILRGGIRAIPRGEVEAAKAFGMSWAMLQRRIILPRALRIAWPAYGNEVVLLLKGSALVSTITVWDLMGETRSVFSRTYALEIFLYAAIIYFLLTFILTRIFNQIEKRINRYLVCY